MIRMSSKELNIAGNISFPTVSYTLAQRQKLRGFCLLEFAFQMTEDVFCQFFMKIHPNFAGVFLIASVFKSSRSMRLRTCKIDSGCAVWKHETHKKILAFRNFTAWPPAARDTLTAWKLES